MLLVAMKILGLLLRMCLLIGERWSERNRETGASPCVPELHRITSSQSSVSMSGSRAAHENRCVMITEFRVKSKNRVCGHAFRLSSPRARPATESTARGLAPLHRVHTEI